jgi:ribosome-associated protein
VTLAATAAADKLATDLIAYDVSEQLVITDAFLLCSASNDRQVRSIVDEIELVLSRAGAKPVRREGEREGRWVLLDYLDVVIHVQHAEERVFYAPGRTLFLGLMRAGARRAGRQGLRMRPSSWCCGGTVRRRGTSSGGFRGRAMFR